MHIIQIENTKYQYVSLYVSAYEVVKCNRQFLDNMPYFYEKEHFIISGMTFLQEKYISPTVGSKLCPQS